MKNTPVLFTAMLALALTLNAQTVSAPAANAGVCPASVPNTPYSYFGSTGLGYDQFSKLPSFSTGFGVKTGSCSNAFLVTTITTGIGSNNPTPGYAMLSERFEYHIAHSNYFEFIGDGQIGVVQQGAGSSNTVTTATFGGGGAIAFDLGYLASRKKFHLPIVVHADYVAAPNAPANAVKPSYLLDIRKTF